MAEVVGLNVQDIEFQEGVFDVASWFSSLVVVMFFFFSWSGYRFEVQRRASVFKVLSAAERKWTVLVMPKCKTQRRRWAKMFELLPQERSQERVVEQSLVASQIPVPHIMTEIGEA